MDFKPFIRRHADDLIASLQTLIRIPSVEGQLADGAPFGRDVQDCLEATLDLCRSLGFRTENIDNMVGYCEYGEGDEMIAVLGHLDVVPAGDGWTKAPFGGETEAGRIYGRGTMDDKGPTVAALYALAALKDAGFTPSRRIRILFGTNEETGCKDMKHYLAQGGETPVMGFTPDGEYPIINGEKGIMNCTFTKKLHQTGDYKLTRFEGGTASNVSPAYAVAEIRCPADAAGKIDMPRVTVTAIEGGLRIEAEGVSAHGSTPEQGENAIGRLAMALARLPLSGELLNTIAFLADRIGMETRGESLGIAMRDELSGDLTVNLGVAKGNERELSVTLSVRYPVTKTYDEVYPRLIKAFSLAGFAETAMMHKAAIYMPPESELIQKLSRVYEAETGEKAVLKSIGGGTYAKSIPNLVAFGPIFPGDEVREHKPDEYMEIERLIQNAEIIAAAMYELAK
ncbi:dipeptidase PepV [Agathobaculum sp.]|uniref:dipeptidase PepV n=1 Tax=Agathobaculum sp. TaxID=2048138 RepID=UPI002A7FA4AD|nr:dipeptidase PepV [Agathobaculum sp.]MDY3618601.1 dipeptidase PepV [Agathobaculum sp.]